MNEVLESNPNEKIFRDAARTGNVNKLRELLPLVNVNAREPITNMTALHYAARAKQYDAIGVLSEAYPDVNIQDLNGDTPLHIACRNADLQSVYLLLIPQNPRSYPNAEAFAAARFNQNLNPLIPNAAGKTAMNLFTPIANMNCSGNPEAKVMIPNLVSCIILAAKNQLFKEGKMRLTGDIFSVDKSGNVGVFTNVTDAERFAARSNASTNDRRSAQAANNVSVPPNTSSDVQLKPAAVKPAALSAASHHAPLSSAPSATVTRDADLTTTFSNMAVASPAPTAPLAKNDQKPRNDNDSGFPALRGGFFVKKPAAPTITPIPKQAVKPVAKEVAGNAPNVTEEQSRTTYSPGN